MRTASLAAIAAVSLCFGMPAGATMTQDADAETEAEGSINASNTIVCRRLPPPVGQRFGQGRRICATEAQWQNYEDEVRNTVNEAFNRSKAFSN